MLAKFFKNKNGGNVAGINYLLNHLVKDETAFVLKGSEVVTRRIVSNMAKKQKLCIGCLSFEEADIDLSAKQKIADEFETLLFGEYKERFNILWVQHIDKGRLELNFAIPKIDLESQMAFTPYYDETDRALIDAWQNLPNFKFNFSDPNGEQQIINILFLTKGFLIMTLLEQTLLTQLEEKEKWEQDMVMLFKTLKEKLVSIETESTNNINSLYPELSNLQLQLTNLQKESENQTFFQENYMMQLENLKKSLESMY